MAPSISVISSHLSLTPTNYSLEMGLYGCQSTTPQNLLPSPMSSSACAISVTGLYYSRPKCDDWLLRNINMEIPSGAIYGLLGPSGCGKTTLLRCVVGCLRPKFGTVRLFGKRPGRHICKIPGPNVGYMPQESALYENMSIDEILIYYGRVYLMPFQTLAERIKELKAVLDLPISNQRVASLSGGQKRRVSFAVALIHHPKLIILDEPTSGVDPLLREKIWQHLVYLSKHDNMTIIITTHYIEESRRSNMVGFMRKGQLLNQDSPSNLMNAYKQSSLEGVFLKMCLENRTNQKPNYLCSSEPKLSYKSGGRSNYEWRTSLKNWYTIFITVLWQYMVRDLRDPFIIFFQYCIPIVQVVLFSICIGGTPKSIPLAVYNEDYEYGQSFVDGLSDEMFSVSRYSSLVDAKNSVGRLKNWAAIWIPSDFTNDTEIRIGQDEDDFSDYLSSNMTLSSLMVYGDFTNKVIATTMMRYLNDYSIDFLRRLNGSVTFMTHLPIQMMNTIYGSYRKNQYDGLRNFMIPGLTSNITFAIAYSLTALALISERNQQTFERNYVAGVTTTQMLLAHVLSRIIFMIPYLFIILYIPIYFFGIPAFGNIFLAVLILTLLNFCGMTYGMVISALCETIEMGTILSAGTLFVVLFMSGAIWPIESIPKWFRWMCQLAPTTMATESLRAVLYKSWGLETQLLENTVLIILIWTLILFLIGWKFYRFNR